MIKLFNRKTMPLYGLAFVIATSNILESSNFFASGSGSSSFDYFLEDSAMLVTCLFLYRISRGQDPRRWFQMLTIGATVLLAVSVLILKGYIPAVPVQTGRVFLGVSFGILYVFWGEVYSEFDRQSVISGIFGSVVVGAVISTFGAIGITPVTALAIAVLLPVFSDVFLFNAANLFSAQTISARSASKPDSGRPLSHTWPFDIRFTLYSASIMMLAGLQRAIFPISGYPYALENGFNIAAFISSIFEVIISISLFSIVRSREDQSIRGLPLAILLLIGAGYFLLPFRPAGGIPLALNSAGQLTSLMLLWIICTHITEERCIPGLHSFAALFVAVACGRIISDGIGMIFRLFTIFKPWEFEIRTLLVFIAIFILLLVVAFLRPKDDFERRTESDSMAPITVEERCSILGTNMHLSPREEEILVLIAHGRSIPYIQDQLVLSKSTVKTHIKHIYEKSSVSSRQELLNLLERMKKS